MVRALPAASETFHPCDCCGRPATTGLLDHLEMYPVRDDEGTLWRTVIPLGPPYYRCDRHVPGRFGNRRKWSVFEHEDPFQSRESVRARERRAFTWRT